MWKTDWPQFYQNFSRGKPVHKCLHNCILLNIHIKFVSITNYPYHYLPSYCFVCLKSFCLKIKLTNGKTMLSHLNNVLVKNRMDFLSVSQDLK